MAFSTTQYCTLAQVKQALDLQKITQDAWIQELIEESQATLDRKIGYSFQVDGSTGSPSSRYYDGTGFCQLLINPCQSLSQILETTYNTSVGSNGIFQMGTTQTYDITVDCYLAPNNISPQYLLKRISGLPFLEGNRNYMVSGVWGFPSVPSDISRACTRLAVHFYKMRDTNYADLLAEQGAVRQKYTKEIPIDVMEVINDYKHRTFVCR